jgi:hypothetical protein
MNFPNPARSSFGMVRVGEAVYIAGGHVGRFHNYSRDRFSAACHVLDLATMKWSAIRDYGSNKHGAAPLAVQGLRLVEYDGNIYGFGGFCYEAALDYQNETDPWQWYARTRTEIFRYSPKNDEWALIGHLPRPRSSYVAGRVGSRGYLIGGWDGTPLEREDELGAFGRLYSSIEVFDFELERIVPTTLAIEGPMRRAFTATCDAKRIVVAGGLGPATMNDPEGAKYDWVQTFAPEQSQRWQYLPPLPVNLFSPGICEVAGTLVVAGGSRYDRRPNEEVFILKPGARSWTPNSKRPSRAGTFMELVPLQGREVLVLGGHSGSRTDPNPLGLCERIAID